MSLLANLWDAERIIIKRDARIAELEAERNRLRATIDNLIEWWEGRCGDVIETDAYQELRKELYTIAGKPLVLD